MTTKRLPDEVHSALQAAAKHPVKRKNLQKLHDLCRTRFEAGSAAWAVADIARSAEKENILKASSLGLPQSEDYRTLIQAWREAAEPANLRSKRKARSHSDWIDVIDDPAARALVEGLRIENEKLKAKVRALQKYQQPVTIYAGIAQPAATLDVQVESTYQRLLPMEKEVLLRESSEEYWLKAGCNVDKLGKVTTEDGWIVHEVGFLVGLRKLLSS